MTARQPIPDSEANVWLQPLKAAGHDEAAIDAALDRLLGHPDGRYSLVGHLADFAVLALDPSLPDWQRGRIVREHFGGRFLSPGDGLKRAADGTIVRQGVDGWNR